MPLLLLEIGIFEPVGTSTDFNASTTFAAQFILLFLPTKRAHRMMRNPVFQDMQEVRAILSRLPDRSAFCSAGPDDCVYIPGC
jgi:hypothetical protein